MSPFYTRKVRHRTFVICHMANKLCKRCLSHTDHVTILTSVLVRINSRGTKSHQLWSENSTGLCQTSESLYKPLPSSSRTACSPQRGQFLSAGLCILETVNVSSSSVKCVFRRPDFKPPAVFKPVKADGARSSLSVPTAGRPG